MSGIHYIQILYTLESAYFSNVCLNLINDIFLQTAPLKFFMNDHLVTSYFLQFNISFCRVNKRIRIHHYLNIVIFFIFNHFVRYFKAKEIFNKLLSFLQLCKFVSLIVKSPIFSRHYFL
jgi:hypothetical protein